MVAATILRPKLLAVRNRWRKKSDFSRQRAQDLLILIFSLGMLVGTYQGTVWTLQRIKDLPFLVHLPPALPLGLVLLLLMAMLWISSLVTSISSLYFADDLEILLAAPIRSRSIFTARVVYITAMVSWMPFVFIAPVLIAFGQVYGAPWWYYPYSLAVLIPYFVIPVAISTTIAVLLMALIDPRWTRVIAFVILSLILVCIYFTIEMIASVFSPDQRNDQVLKLVNIFRQASSSWNPASWASRAIAEVLEPSGHSIFLRLSLLFCCSVSMLGVAFGCVELLHLRGYTRAKNSRLSRRSTAERKPRSAVFVGHPIMSLIQKEFRSIFRDVAQSAQVLFLGCMCLIYLMNLRFFVSLDSFPPDSRTWWQNLFFIMHCSVAAFFTTAVCTRVVFSSTSLEGRAFWILQTAPIEFRRILRAKFLFWLPPVALVSGIIFAVGAFTISGRLDFVLVHIPSSIFVSYGIVGLGVGLGAYFSDFNWDHPSQLALGLGSFFFMLGSALLVFLNVIPVWLMLQVGRGQPFVAADLFQERGLVIVLATITIGALNYLVAQTAMEQGEAALERAFR